MQLFSAFLFGVGFACLLILGLYFPHSNKWRNAIVDRLLDAGIDWDESDPTLAINTLFTPDALLELERKKTIKDFYLIPVADRKSVV